MTEADLNKNNERGGFWVFLVFGFFIAIMVTLIHFSEHSTKELFGIDGYARLTRVTDLYQTGNWYHPTPMKSNTPYGDTVPWTRPFDMILLAGAVPLSQFVDFDTALFWWSLFVGPVLLVITLVVFYWAVNVLLSREASLLIIFIIAVQFGFITSFRAARPDHHGFLALFFVLLTGFLLRLVILPFSRKLCWLAGLTAALAVWASIESMVIVGLMIVGIGLLWLFTQGDFLWKSLHASVSLLFSIFLALLLERPWSEIFTVEYDRISIVYCLLFALIAVFWAVGAVVYSRTKLFESVSGRIAYGFLGLSIIGCVMWLIFPGFYKGPLADMDAKTISIWLNHIQELQPLYTETGSLIPFVQVAGQMLIGTVFIIYMLFKTKDEAGLRGWSILLLITVVFSFLTIRQIRWAVYPQVLLSIPMAELLSRVLSRLKEDKPMILRVLYKSVIILVFSVGFLFLGLLADEILGRQDEKNKNLNIPLIPLCKYFNEISVSADRNLRLLTYNNFASEILYRTNYEVVGSNYHRNKEGILDNHTVMTTEKDERALEILKKRDIDYILLPLENTQTLIHDDSKTHSTFIQRLRNGQLPIWLKKVELPKDLSENFLMFETNF